MASRTQSIATRASKGKAPKADACPSSKKNSSPLPGSRKRKACYDDEENDYEGEQVETDEKPQKKKKASKQSEEKRLRRFRTHAPASYLERLVRVTTQRMFLIDRERKTSEDGLHEIEVVDLAGSTGNVYQVTIDKAPSCTCPDCSKGNQCKHIIYVMVNVLKAPSQLAYQLALLSTELELIFANAPISPQLLSKDSPSSDGNRKPVEGDCPVCVMEMTWSDDIVWCKAACGNNIHRECQRQWAKSKPGHVKCVYCRTPWQEDVADKTDLKRLVKSEGAVATGEGYMNVGRELGLSRRRDTSTYSSWGRDTWGRGW